MVTRSPHDRMLARAEDTGSATDWWDSDTAEGRQKISEREREATDEAWRVFVRQIAGGVMQAQLATFTEALGEMFANERKRWRADDETQRLAMLQAVGELIGEAEPPPPAPAAASPATTDALEARVAAIEADLVTINAQISALSEQVSSVLPPVPLGFGARGLYDPTGKYKSGDRVAYDGCEWISKIDDPGDLPGPGWMLAVSRGARGKPGKPGVSIAGLSVEGTNFIIAMSDGHKARVDLAPVVDAMLARKHVA